MTARPGPNDRLARPWDHGVDVEGHRGARGLVVENTVPSFLAAVEAGATGLELDVRLTADGHVVVFHDPVLGPTTCVATRDDLIGLRVDDLTLEQLRTIDVGTLTHDDFPSQQAVPGATVPTLAELLDACADVAPDVWWTIELKVDATDQREVAGRDRLVDAVLATIHDKGIDRRCFVHSFDWAVLERSEREAPELLRSALAVDGVTYAPDSPWTGSLRWDDHGPDLCAAVAALGAHVVSPHHASVDRAFVERAHGHGLGVLPWTANDVDELRRLVEAGVDGIVTDYPDRLVALLAERDAGRDDVRGDGRDDGRDDGRHGV